jgi:dipeptidyl aminopeptidase/acylaminoacyl peptidase
LQRDYTKEKPAGDEVYKAYKNLYVYDRTELAPAVEAVDESARYWRRERVTFNAAYGKERVIAQLFLPRDRKPPYQAVVYFPGASAFIQRSKSDSIRAWELEFIARSGRAFIYPVYRGTYERGFGVKEKPAADSVTWRDMIINCYKDLGRSLDYLETRQDINSSKIAYYGVSSGGTWGPMYLAVDERFRAAVFVVGGLAYEYYRPEADPLHFAQHVKTPVLMLNGRYDFASPLQGCQLPLYQLLGTPEADKRHVLFDSAHSVPRNAMIKESLDWFDRNLGPVE